MELLERRTFGHRGYSPAVLDEVWEITKGFGAYGFCRAHTVAFAVPALQSAWLKAHHPVTASRRISDRPAGAVSDRWSPGPRTATGRVSKWTGSRPSASLPDD